MTKHIWLVRWWDTYNNEFTNVFNTRKEARIFVKNVKVYTAGYVSKPTKYLLANEEDTNCDITTTVIRD